ncbi:putative ketoreductase [Phaeomoniella chlamydospora]|uniref:D-xylose reductase [NAD(P)H] n=1 Tax=Phaeomoniella chlamydospora TaxID=158046 RepID=A0A0G2DRX5_PHACM|nr:putative ketoreductase [Phaeomoniella chlamydospora]
MSELNLKVPTTKLPNGAQMPVIGYGLGTAASSNKKAGSFFSSVDKGLVEIIGKAIAMGYYHLDGAEMYSTDVDLGAAVKASKLPREKFFITAKLDPSTPSIDNVSSTLDKALKDMSVDYVDLFLIHEPFFAKDNEKLLQKKWSEMEALQKSGKTKAIGVSNFLQPHIETILKTAEIPPAVNQVEFHPYLQREGLVDFCKSKNIQVTAYGPLTPATRAKGKSEDFDKYLDILAKKYYVSPGEILLRWCIDQDVIPITTTSKEIRMSDYLRALTFKLTLRELDEIAEQGKKVHYRAFWRAKFAEDDKR